MPSKRNVNAPRELLPSQPPPLSKRPIKKETPEICLDFGQIIINDPTGKVNAKDLRKVRANAMRQHHQKRRAKPQEVPVVHEIEDDVGIAEQKRQELGKLVMVHSKFQPSLLGAGQNDPFIRLPVANPPKRYYELIDHYTMYGTAFTRDHFLKIAKSPVAFYGSLFSASSHLEALRSTRTTYDAKIESELEQLEQKGEAIRSVQLALNGGEPGKQYDELIHAILILGVHETRGDEEAADWSPFLAPLRDLQWMDIYGTRRYSKHHMMASQDVIRKRGGPRKVKMLGVAWLMASMELNSCVAGLTPPSHPLLNPDGIDVEYRMHTTSTSEESYSGFTNLHNLRFFPELSDLLPKIRDYSQVVERIQNGVKPPDLMLNRNWVIHRLLSLPSAATIIEQTRFVSEKFERTLFVYEACRLTCLMYGIHVVFPTPRSRSPRERLLPLLQEAISKVDLEAADQVRELKEMITWCLVIGGIAATGREERTWFIEELKTVSSGLGMGDWQWVQFKAGLRRFAWVAEACDPGGESLWNDTLAVRSWSLEHTRGLPILPLPQGILLSD